MTAAPEEDGDDRAQYTAAAARRKRRPAVSPGPCRELGNKIVNPSWVK
jgi:hypothetical protein